ncbi:MAG: YCF48-related protein [Bryobacteraceae bacterium]
MGSLLHGGVAGYGLACLIALGIASTCRVFAQKPADWALQYFYDEEKSELVIADLACPSASRCIAVGTIQDRDGRGKPRFTAVVTSDAGARWALVPLREQPRSVFFLNEDSGWMVTRDGVWFTEEAGRAWTRIADQIKPNKKLDRAPDSGLLLRIWFVDPQHGYGVGLQKAIYETKDGGHTWAPLEEAAKPSSNPAFSYYARIAFADSKHGLMVGGYAPPRRGSDDSLPDWMDPERALKRREVPTLTLEVETRDAGTTWRSSTAPLIGSIASLHLANADGLAVFGYADSFAWPSEVFHLDLKNGKSGSVFKQKDRRVTDSAIFAEGPAFLAAIEPPGQMASVPIPGKVKILISDNFTDWNEMKVDYRAVGRSVVLAGPDANHVWAATDTGMILSLKSTR